MAKATLSKTLRHIWKGVQLKHSTLSPTKGLGSYFQYHPEGCTIREKHPLRKYDTKGDTYVKELFCYVDELYRNMDGFWKTLWIGYYRVARKKKFPRIQPVAKRAYGREIDQKKEFGVYSLWMHEWIKDLVEPFNELQIGSFWIILDARIEDENLKFTFHYTNRTEETVPITFFDPNLLRFGGRI